MTSSEGVASFGAYIGVAAAQRHPMQDIVIFSSLTRGRHEYLMYQQVFLQKSFQQRVEHLARAWTAL